MGTNCLIYRRVFTKKISTEEKKRKGTLLSVILYGIIILSLIATIINICVDGYSYDSLFEFLPALTLGIFLILNCLVKKGFLFLPSLIVIGLLSISAYYLEFNFGTVIPHSWILLALSIVIGGILISSKFALILTVIYTLITLSLTYLQEFGNLKYIHWDGDPTLGAVLVTMIILQIIAIISWLSNKEIEKALIRAKKSENDLKKERDHLELEVEKRVKEIKKIQLERISNLYKFADFGRLTVGLFHDIANPLTQVSLNLSNIEYQTRDKLSAEFNKVEPAIKRAIRGTEQMAKMIVSVRKQIQQQGSNLVYKPWTEIENVIENLKYKALEMKVKISIVGEKDIKTLGNSIRFYQLVSNLVSNALDAYYEVVREENRKIIIGLNTNEKEIILTVEDFGCGISEDVIEKIFDPLFTTKDFKRGSGIGLYISKNIVEKEFKGQMKVKSKLNKGTLFTIKFPLIRKSNEK
jgi:signal transduction histidine kinase